MKSLCALQARSGLDSMQGQAAQLQRVAEAATDERDAAQQRAKELTAERNEAQRRVQALSEEMQQLKAQSDARCLRCNPTSASKMCFWM